MKIKGLKYGKDEGVRECGGPDLRNSGIQDSWSQESTATQPPVPSVALSSEYFKKEGEIEVRILFVLSGGENRERNYFKMLKDDRRLERIKVAFASKKGQGLTPTQLLERANSSIGSKRFATEDATFRFEKENGDVIYLLQDIDQFESEILQLADDDQPDCLRWIYSNPAFEIWLYYHYFEKPLPNLKDAIDKTTAERSRWLKGYLPEIIEGGVKTTKAIERIRDAIINSRANYEEENRLPRLFSTQMHYLAEDILDIMGDEFDQMLERRAARNKSMMERFRKPIVKLVRYDGEKIRSLIDAFSKWADSNPLKLPHTETDDGKGSCYYDNRVFPLNYKIEKSFLDDDSGKPMPVNTDELYMVNIQDEIYHFYHVLFIQNSPIASFTIDFSEIKEAIDLLGLDNQYCLLSSFHLSTFDSLYGGEALKETDWGYVYKDVEIHQIRTRGRFMIIMRKEYLPRADFKSYEGENAEFELIDGRNYIYSNIHQMKDLGNYYGLSVMRAVKFQLPQKGSFRFIKLNIVDYAKDKSELDKLSKADIVSLQYQKGDFVKYGNHVYEILGISREGEIALSWVDKPVSFKDISPVSIDGIQDGNIYYDPIVAAFMVPADAPIPAVTVNEQYYMESFKNDVLEDGSTLYEKVMECHFAYVHELQHWLLETQGQSGLKIRLDVKRFSIED